MQRFSKFATHMSLLAALSHVFCCGLPMLAAILSLGATAGSTIGLSSMHETLHEWEAEILMFSGAMLSLSGVSLWISRRVDCRSEGACCHEPCAPKKDLSFRLFIVASVIFTVNFALYLNHRFEAHETASVSVPEIHETVHHTHMP